MQSEHELTRRQELEMIDPEVFSMFNSIAPEEIEQQLGSVEENKEAGIKIMLLREGTAVNLYAALVRRHVNAHVHEHEPELYRIGEGAGEMYTGVTKKEGDNIEVFWQPPIPVEAGTVLEIPENVAHCLKSSGGAESPLVLIFISPTNHLKNTSEGGDRIFVETPLEALKND